MQAGEGQLHLGLHASGPRHPAIVSPLGQITQQGALAHARIPAYDQRPALPRLDRIDQAVEHVPFPVPVGQLLSHPASQS